MAKDSGLGDRFYVGGYDLSGDTQQLREITGHINLLDVTDLTQSAYARLGGQRDGHIGWTSFHNTSAGRAHVALSALPRGDIAVTYAHGVALGAPCATMLAKQLNYDGNRDKSGMLTFSLDAQANGYGLAWGQQLTAGVRTDTAATNGTSIDTTASASFGWAFVYHLTALTGTDVTIKIQDSADNSSFADVTGATSGTLTAIGSNFLISATGTATVRRYLRAVTTTVGGFTSASFAVAFVKGADVPLVF